MANVPTFPELELAVRDAIDRLGGAVVPKLNWSCPKDAAWISPTGSVKCTNPAEVFLLLKSSDSIVHDLLHAFDGCEGSAMTRPPVFMLALRKWHDLRPEMEFRCFVRRGELIAISQREVTSLYPTLLERRYQMRDLLVDFFEETVSGAFDDPDYTFDAYVTRSNKVKVLDFNPFGGATLPLLFTWDELLSRTTALALPNGRSATLDSNNIVNGDGHVSNESAIADHGNGDSRSSDRLYPESCSRSRSEAIVNGNGCTEAAEEEVRNDDRSNGGRLPLDEGVELRVVQSQEGVHPSLRAASGAPFDLVDVSSGSALEEFLERVQLLERDAEQAEGGTRRQQQS
ncbi:hypothetical protein CBR_g50844 [Chara braunii]|uniref:Cell division cycle protein 123 n=1 Tax=Chara braunii TaxID=69332 RepID=A0A388M7C8_CHABU|nr:hypothetical protein CBR_g50844 [Chara braunii]|eukprot:GBG90497.1 hypothetical protein CBR_g50844 [Chara braunii]